MMRVVTAVVLFRKALAHYLVSETPDGWYQGGLQNYAGNKADKPPELVRFTKDGRHCTGNTSEQDLIDELYEAVQNEIDKKR